MQKRLKKGKEEENKKIQRRGKIFEQKEKEEKDTKDLGRRRKMRTGRHDNGKEMGKNCKNGKEKKNNFRKKKRKRVKMRNKKS
jgi:hypothetical protein